MKSSERREYFRVDDDVRISYREIDEETTEELTRAIRSGLPGAFQLRAELENSDHELEYARRQLGDLPQSLQRYLQLLDQKVGQLSQVVELLAGNPETASIYEVSLSGGGIAMPVPNALAIAQMVELCIQISGGSGAIHALAEVTDCRVEGDKYHVALEFRCIDEEDQEAIIRRTVQRQAEQIRETHAKPA
ncbi:MAG: PilZ domain-containing protein [Immundisolibacteraceae bacterium]|nr:PilZ domain-containing protein [Immundisolibacteraceae bacterium]